MTRWVKETLLAAILLILPIVLLCRNSSSTEEFVDINVHDVYFVIDPAIAVSVVYTLIYFLLYLVRALVGNFRNSFVNIVLMVLTAALIVVIWYLNKTVEYMSAGGWTIYPPLSGPPQEIPPSEPVIDMTNIIILQVILLLLFSFTMYKTLRKPKQL